MARILVISPEPSHPQDAGNRARIYVLLRQLQESGHEIHFVFLENPWQKSDPQAMAGQWNGFHKIRWKRPPVPLRKRVYDLLAWLFWRKRVLPYRIDDWLDERIFPPIRDIATKLRPDIVLAEYVYISRILEIFGRDVLKVLDTHDVFGNRDRLFIENRMKPLWFYTSEAEEKKGLERADIIMAIQEREAEYFRKLSTRKVITVGHLVRPDNAAPPEQSPTPRILFVGSDNPSNLDGIGWFIEKVFGIVREQMPGIELDLVGNIARCLKPAPGLRKSGTVADLAPCYRQAAVVINPLRFGTGLKIKTIEALAMQRPLVTTPCGASGIEEWVDRAFLCAKTPEEFAAAILRAIRTKELRLALAKGAEEFTELHNRQVLAALQEEINTFMNKKRGI